MKMIKFDLPIDGVKVKNVEELRDHFTVEILDHYRSGLLEKWLLVRKMDDELAAMKALDGSDNAVLLKGLCGIFGVDVDDEIIAALLNQAPEKRKNNIEENSGIYRDLAEIIDLTICKAIRLNCITANYEVRKFDHEEAYDVFWKEDRDNFFRGENFFSEKSGIKFFAPFLCELVEKVAVNEQKLTSGSLAGWFMLPESAEDYSGNWVFLSSILKQRKKLLLSVSEETNISTLKKAINNRVLKITRIAEVIDGFLLNLRELVSDACSGHDDYAKGFAFMPLLMMYCHTKEFKEMKKDVLKNMKNQKKEISDDQRNAAKLVELISVGDAFFKKLDSLSEDEYRLIFFEKKSHELDVEMYGLEEDEEAKVDLFVKVGDFVKTNDIIGKRGYSYEISSPATGFVKEIYIDEDDEVSNGMPLFKIEVYRREFPKNQNPDSDQIGDVYQKIKESSIEGVATGIEAGKKAIDQLGSYVTSMKDLIRNR